MSLDRRRLKLIRERLATLYGDEVSARMVAADVGIDTSQVDFSGGARRVWFLLLEQANNESRLATLLDRIREDYPDDEILSLGQPREVELPRVPDALVQAGARRQLFVVLGPGMGASLRHRLVDRAGFGGTNGDLDKPYMLRNLLRKRWPGDALAKEIVATLEALDEDLRAVREVTLGMLAQVPGARFVVTMPERTFERVRGVERGRPAADIRDDDLVPPGDVVRTRGDRRDPRDLERLLGAERVDWIAGPPEATGWRRVLGRWFEEGQRALLVGFDGEQTEKALEELRDVCGGNEPAVHVLLADEPTASEGLSIAGDRVIVLPEGRLAALWVERLRDAIELRASRDDLRSAREVVAYYGAEVEEEFKSDVQRVRDALDRSRYEEARTLAESLTRTAEMRAEKDRDRWRSWVLHCRLNLATAQICLQQHDDARATLRDVTDEEIATHDARIQAVFAEQLAILGEPERARAILERLPNPLPEDVERVAAARWRIALMRGEIPDGEAPKGGHLQADLAQLWLDRGDLAKCAEHALRSLDEGARPLDLLIASRLLLIALERTVVEDPPFIRAMPVAVRPRVVDALERSLHVLAICEPPFPMFRGVALTLNLRFYTLSGDPARAEEAQRGLAEMGEHVKVDQEETHRARRVRLLREGRESLVKEEIASLLPPWRRERIWLIALDEAGQSERALREALALNPNDQSHGLIAGLIAGLLVRAARPDEALPHARRAFEEVPVRGARAALADCLGRLRAFEEAERIAAPLADTKNVQWLWMLAGIASDLSRPDAPERWRAVVAIAPQDVRARECLACALQDCGRTEEAADEAWQNVALGLEAELALEDLIRIAVRQRMASAAEHVDRLRRIAELLASRFPGDARAEAARHELLAALDFPDDLPPANYDLLESGGVLHRASIDDYVEQRNRRARAVTLLHFWYRLGNLTFDAFSSLTHVEPAMLVRGFSEAARHGLALVSAPIRLGAEHEKLDLRGARLLLGHLELLLLQRLELFEPLRHAVGSEGRLVIFRDLRDEIHESAARLEQSAQRLQLRECERLSQHLYRSPAVTVSKDVLEEDDDREWAHARGFAVIEARTELTPPTEATLLSPRHIAEQLHRNGHIDAETHRRLVQRLGHDPAGAVLPMPLPQRVAITYPALVNFFEAGALDALAPMFGHPVAVGPRTEALVRSRREDLSRTVEAADLALALPRSLGGQWDVIDRHEIELPPLRKDVARDRNWSETTVLTPLRQALSIRAALREGASLRAVTADWFVWRPDSAEEVWRQFDWSAARAVDSQTETLLRDTRERVWSFTGLVGALGLGEREDDLRLELARMGFTDALTPEALLGLARRFGALDGAVAKRVLGAVEHMARPSRYDIGQGPVVGMHLGRVPAALAIASLYARTIAAMFAPAAFAPDVRARCARSLFDRLEALAGESMLDVVGVAASFLANESIQKLGAHVDLEPHSATMRSDGPVFLAWREFLAWAGGASSRTAPILRGYRRLLLALDRPGAGPASGLALHVLANVADTDVTAGGAVDLTRPPWRELASLFLGSHPSSMAQKVVSVRSHATGRGEDVGCEHLLAEGAKQLATGALAPAESFLEARYEVPLMSGEVRLRVRAPVEALLLRIPGEACAEPAAELAAMNGPYDPATRDALRSLAEHPERDDLRREVARASLCAPWRMVREDPNALLLWRHDARRGFEITPSSLAQLRELLSEPPHPLPDGSIFDWLPKRLGDGGHWSSREDLGELFLRAASVPWPIFAIAHLEHDGDVPPLEVAAALELLEAPEERPIGALCAHLAFLHRVAARQRYVRLGERELDLHAELPAAWLRALRSVIPDRDTPRAEALPPLADHEAALLRRCGRVVSDLLARFDPLPLRDGLWLTWQLYNWLVGVLDTLPAAERSAAIESIARADPPPPESLGDNRDLWNPFGFHRFEHRLTALLHAFVIGHEVSLNNQGGAVASEAIEELLLGVAGRPSTPFDDEVRALGSSCTHFDWSTSGAVPDLALTALLSMNPDAFARLPELERRLWIARLPRAPRQPGCVDDVLASRIVASLARALPALSRAEQVGFREYLGTVETSDEAHTFAWKLGGLTALLSAGHTELGALVRAGVLLAPESAVARACLVEYLSVRTREAPASLDDEMESLLAEVTPPSARVGVALAPSSLVLSGNEAQVAAATAWLEGLAARPEFAHHEDVAKVRSALGLDDTPSNVRQ